MENSELRSSDYAQIKRENLSKIHEENEKPSFLKLIAMERERDYIGFATLPEQVHRKSVKRGFDFTLMVVGEAGLGKSTLINSLFLGDLRSPRPQTEMS